MVRETTTVYCFFNYDKGDTFGTKNEGVLHFQSSTSKVHNDYEQLLELILQKRISQHVVDKQSNHRDYCDQEQIEINVGDIVNFSLLKYALGMKTIKKIKTNIYLDDT